MALDDRRREIESRYAHDEEKKFKIESRRNRIFGQWAAGRLGKSGPEADAYAQEVVKASFARAGDDDIFEKVRADFAAAGVTTTDHELTGELEKAYVEAEAQVAQS